MMKNLVRNIRRVSGKSRRLRGPRKRTRVRHVFAFLVRENVSRWISRFTPLRPRWRDPPLSPVPSRYRFPLEESHRWSVLEFAGPPGDSLESLSKSKARRIARNTGRGGSLRAYTFLLATVSVSWLFFFFPSSVSCVIVRSISFAGHETRTHIFWQICLILKKRKY